MWQRHRRWAADGTWDMVLVRLTAQADSINGIDWTVMVDSTINRAHLHATNTTRPETDTSAATRRSKSGTPATGREPAGVPTLDTETYKRRFLKAGPRRPRGPWHPHGDSRAC